MRRLCLIFAALAALLGAPSLASAAGNALGAPSATPTSGTATTVFTLRVTYGSVKGWTEDGAAVPPYTRLGGLYDRHTGSPPFNLPSRWLVVGQVRESPGPEVTVDGRAFGDGPGGWDHFRVP